MPRDDKVAILKESLAAIGRRIDVVLGNKRTAGEDVEPGGDIYGRECPRPVLASAV